MHQDESDQLFEITVELYEDRIVGYLDKAKSKLFGIISLKNGKKKNNNNLTKKN